MSAGTARIAADRRPCTAVALQPQADAYRRGAGVREPASQRANILGRQPADLGGALHRPLRQPRLELGPALGVTGEPLAVLGALVEHGAHEPERECGIGARSWREMLVAALGSVRAQRVDCDHVRPAPLRGQHEAPLVEVGGEQVRAPQDHEPRVLEVLRLMPTEPP